MFSLFISLIFSLTDGRSGSVVRHHGRRGVVVDHAGRCPCHAAQVSRQLLYTAQKNKDETQKKTLKDTFTFYIRVFYPFVGSLPVTMKGFRQTQTKQIQVSPLIQYNTIQVLLTLLVGCRVVDCHGRLGIATVLFTLKPVSFYALLVCVVLRFSLQTDGLFEGYFLVMRSISCFRVFVYSTQRAPASALAATAWNATRRPVRFGSVQLDRKTTM